MKLLLSNKRKWTRQCPNYKQAIANTAIACGVEEEVVGKIIGKYFYCCKKHLLNGERVSLPGLLNMAIHHNQLKTLRKFMTYKQLKKRYGKKEYFIKNQIKRKK